jgi:type 1 fimbria pilin
MNTKVLFSILFSIGFMFTACNKEDDSPAKPIVTIHELGHGDSHSNDNSATIGSSLHMDIEIVAEGKFDYIQVKIHPEGEHEHAGDHEEWEIDTTFSGTAITGLKNLDFHKDLKIDDHAEAGDYHFDVIVVDQNGNSGSDEAELELLEQATNVTVTNLSINGGEHDVSKASGSFNISFSASADTGTLVSYSIEAHNHPASGKEEDEYKIIDDEFTDSFTGLKMASVNKDITIETNAELGEYHVEIVIKDSEGNQKVLNGHIDLED